jgi:hypothetical protein
MPIQVGATTRRLDQDGFERIAYDVMGYVFEIHNEFGRFFDEKIYKRERHAANHRGNGCDAHGRRPCR